MWHNVALSGVFWTGKVSLCYKYLQLTAIQRPCHSLATYAQHSEFLNGPVTLVESALNGSFPRPSLAAMRNTWNSQAVLSL